MDEKERLELERLKFEREEKVDRSKVFYLIVSIGIPIDAALFIYSLGSQEEKLKSLTLVTMIILAVMMMMIIYADGKLSKPIYNFYDRLIERENNTKTKSRRRK